MPFSRPEHIGPSTVAALTAACLAVRAIVPNPIGITCVANGVIPALGVAKAVGAGWVRANQWVNAYVANEAFLNGPAPEAMRYRSNIRAGDVAIFADVHVKFGAHAITADRSIAEQATDAEWFDADVLIASGTRTGLSDRTARSRRSSRRHELTCDRRIRPYGGFGSFALSDGRRRDRRPMAQARRPLVEPGRSATRRAADGGCREISERAMTLLTEATDVFAAAERSGRSLVAFAAKRQPLASGVFGSDQALRLKTSSDIAGGGMADVRACDVRAECAGRAVRLRHRFRA